MPHQPFQCRVQTFSCVKCVASPYDFCLLLFAVSKYPADLAPDRLVKHVQAVLGLQQEPTHCADQDAELTRQIHTKLLSIFSSDACTALLEGHKEWLQQQAAQFGVQLESFTEILLSTLQQKLRSSADHASLVSVDPADILWLESQRRAVVQLAAPRELPVSEAGQQAAVLALLYSWHCVHVTFVHKATDTSLPMQYTEFTADTLHGAAVECSMHRVTSCGLVSFLIAPVVFCKIKQQARAAVTASGSLARSEK